MEEIKQQNSPKTYAWICNNSVVTSCWFKSLIAFIIFLSIFCAGVSFGEKHGGGFGRHCGNDTFAPAMRNKATSVKTFGNEIERGSMKQFNNKDTSTKNEFPTMQNTQPGGLQQTPIQNQTPKTN